MNRQEHRMESATAASAASPEQSNAADEYAQTLRRKILFGLYVYPYMNPSMLHVFLGTATPKALWKDVILKELIQEGHVTEDSVQLTSPHDRTQTYTILRLRATPPIHGVPPEQGVPLPS
jgi:hypothetical protein